MITLNDCRQGGEHDFKGLSTDDKPTDCAVNSLFLELDTGDFYFFDGTNWKKVSERILLEGSETTIEITENGRFDVSSFDYADVDVPGITPAGILPITENGTYDVTDYATAEVDVDYATVNFNLPTFKTTNPTALSQGRYSLAATTVGNYALFGGGYGDSYSDIVDAYDSDLTRSTPTVLSQGRSGLPATTVGNYALFGGGYGNSYSDIVDAYDSDLTRSTPTVLSQGRDGLPATTVGNYALFGGGFISGSYSDIVDAYDSDLTRSTPTALSQGRSNLTATTVGNYALFGGGLRSGSYLNVVDAYDSDLTRSTPTALSQGRYSLAATTVGNYALFGGGFISGASYSNVVDAYDPYYNIQVFPDTKYSFNGSAEQISSTWETIAMQGPVVGYIKIKNTTVT